MASPDDDHDARRQRSPGVPGLYDAASRFWQKSYAGDYLGLSCVLAAFLVVQMLVVPFHQMFRLDDYRIQHPYAEAERVPPFMLFIYAAAVPAAVLCIWTLALRPDIHEAHVTALGLAITIFTTTFLTDVFKNLIGRPRPDLIARCVPEESAPVHELITIDVCTETSHHKLHDGWRSFPSGHSSFAFAGLGWLALFLASQTYCFRPGASFSTVLLCLLPLLGASAIAISRLEDYRHDVGDVLCGSALGFLIAYATWRRYYPSLASPDCKEPYSQPGKRTQNSNGGFHRVRDEEDTYLNPSEVNRASIERSQE